MQFSLDTVRAVTRLLHDSDLAEISLESTDCDTAASRLTVRRQVPPRAMRRQPASAPEYSGGAGHEMPSGDVPVAETSAANTQDTSTHSAHEHETVTVSATAVGMFRCSQPPIKVGDHVKLGQVAGIVESLKIPNEVIAPVAGKVIDVLAEEGQAVEYGQSLLVINPSQ